MKRIISLVVCLALCLSMAIMLGSCSLINKITGKDKHEHNFVDGKCECGETDPEYVPPHEHNFVDGKCECGESDPNYVPPTHEHVFVDGKCECGEEDPNYVPPTPTPELGENELPHMPLG